MRFLRDAERKRNIAPRLKYNNDTKIDKEYRDACGKGKKEDRKFTMDRRL